MGRKAIRAAKLLRQQELVNAAKTANREMTAEEQAEFDSLQREIDDLSREIEAEEGAFGGGAGEGHAGVSGVPEREGDEECLTWVFMYSKRPRRSASPW